MLGPPQRARAEWAQDLVHEDKMLGVGPATEQHLPGIKLDDCQPQGVDNVPELLNFLVTKRGPGQPAHS